MVYVTSNEKRIKAGNALIILALLGLTIGCWNEYSWYEKIAPYGTLVAFLAMAAACLMYLDIKKALFDKELILVAICDVLALIHLIIIKSNMGAILTVACLSMMIYLCDKVSLSKKCTYIIFCYIAFYFYYWTIDVKGYFKGYNTNYGGLVLITGFAFAIVVLTKLREYLKNNDKKRMFYLVTAFTVFMFAWGYNIIAWYRARCALLGLIVIVVFVVIPQKVFEHKWFYNLFVFGSTLGAVLVSLLYVWLGSVKDTFTIRIFYKDIISGREEIWSELWGEFLRKPITGIGSAYTMKLEWMEGMFEVHNGLLDILIVHGIFVFAICAFLLIKRLMVLRKVIVADRTARAAMAGVMAMLVASFLENFFIVPPFTLCFMLLMAQIFTIGKQNDIII